ncbi:MAG TPA: phasin family protein [Noviherbaspirillum sp.]|jgi:phasin family protein|uniref:phasin family protein n=1 Tax=Noviherbaspirillum sp. TaxID=1926288 RepID=UPI002DDDB020|nr:phasin family protein [Noviherbaspirillum sp.]HEV2609958.1 phasin family protein [Noviherbaspirillum sp.]
MNNFFQSSSSPAVKAQLEAQFAFYADVSKKMFDSIQKLNELNIQVGQTLMEETLSTTRQVLQADDRTEAVSIAAGQAQPAAEKVRAYRQHVQAIFAEAQVGIAQTAETHIPNATRTAEAVVQEVAQKASEQTAKVTQRQKESLEKLTTPIRGAGERVQSSGGATRPQ